MKLIISQSLKTDIKGDEVLLSPLLGHNLFDISEYAADSEFEQIEVENLNTIPLSLLGSVLTSYVKKLRKGGVITVFGVDVYLLANLIVRRELDLGQINLHIFGGPSVNLLNSSLTGVNDVSNHLQELGLKVLSKNLFDEIRFRVEAQRV